MLTRRSLLFGLGAALAAPAVVKAENLMKIARLRERPHLYGRFIADTQSWEIVPADSLAMQLRGREMLALGFHPVRHIVGSSLILAA